MADGLLEAGRLERLARDDRVGSLGASILGAARRRLSSMRGWSPGDAGAVSGVRGSGGSEYEERHGGVSPTPRRGIALTFDGSRDGIARMIRRCAVFGAFGVVGFLALGVFAGDRPQWGEGLSRNMVSSEVGLVETVDV